MKITWSLAELEVLQQKIYRISHLKTGKRGSYVKGAGFILRVEVKNWEGYLGFGGPPRDVKGPSPI